MHFFDREYEGTPLWDVGRPQGEIVRLEEAGEVRGRVLDLGCGTGENAFYLAGRGHETWGVDFAPRAIDKARAKDHPPGVPVRFEVASALELTALAETFDTLIDCGLFHTFLDPHRPVYAAGVAAALRPGGRFFVLCFSEHEPTDWGGPRRVTQAELRSTFGELLRERWIRAADFETRNLPLPGRAWLGAFESRRRAPVPTRAHRQPHPPPRNRTTV
ncbi:MAG: class I SAM-dependent methyltransferase [Thermoplasmata archaeon]